MDREGRFEIKGLPQSRSFNIAITADGQLRSRIRVEAPEPGTSRMEIEPVRLQAANLALAGVVLDEKDRPVRGAVVRSNGEKQPARNRTTDRQGRFVFGGICAGPIQLTANDIDGRQTSLVVEGGDTNIVLRLAAPKQSRFPGAMFQPRVHITVVDADSKPASKIRLYFPPIYGEKATDTQGRFSWNPNTDCYGMVRTQMVAIAMDPVRNLAVSSIMDDKATNIVLQLAPAWILAGRVIGEDGDPITNAQVRLAYRTEQSSQSIGLPLTVDGNGCFEFKGLPRGFAFEIGITAMGYGRAQLKADGPESGKERVELTPIQLPVANLMLV